MNECELLEYAIYHWVFKGENNLPGLDNRGFVDPSFFEDYPRKTSYNEFSHHFSLIKNDPCLNDANSLLLCSGGVDSSLLACLRSVNLEGLCQNLFHISYTNHDTNDLYKFVNILETCPSIARVVSIGASGYISGINFLSDNNFYQNTYAPTLAFALCSLGGHCFSHLITGSGPDELFYGMEKYSWDVFEGLSSIPTCQALEKLDPNYNLPRYSKILNCRGWEILEQVMEKRRALYRSIAALQMNIFESQRLLAYTTVTAQHLQLFNKIAMLFNLKHTAPYLSEQLVALALTSPLADLVELGRDGRVEMGKKHLKKYLSNYMHEHHVYGKKIGFHAPTSKFVFSYSKSFLLSHIEYFPDWLDKDKTIDEINSSSEDSRGSGDYFMYSLLNVVKFSVKNRNGC
jgi:asparagine synthetase B (glutamine-hydrolysing)